jgi:hypothetical protein
MSDLSQQSGAKRTLIRSLSPIAILRIHALTPGSAHQRPAAVAFALGAAVELQDDADVVGQ